MRLLDLAWQDFVVYASQEAWIREQFTSQTGIHFPESPKTPLDKMIDDATNVWESVMFEFAKWVTIEMWGIEFAPKSFQDEIKGEHK